MSDSNFEVVRVARAFAVGDPAQPSAKAASRLRGRPVMMSPNAVIERIRQIAHSESGLYKIHHAHSGLYARARRQFGSWAEAVQAGGGGYSAALSVGGGRSSVRGR